VGIPKDVERLMNGVFVFVLVSLVGLLPMSLGPAGAHPSAILTLTETQGASAVPSHRECPPDLSYLLPEMENLLSSIHDAENFKHTIRQSLTHSLPDAIDQADGLQDQVAFLHQEVTYQNKVIRKTRLIAEGHSNVMTGQALVPCPSGQQGSYCSAVERYYMAKATNLANQGFLEGLLCYQRKGFR